MCLVILFGGFLQQDPIREGGVQASGWSRDPTSQPQLLLSNLSLEGRKHRDLGL